MAMYCNDSKSKPKQLHGSIPQGSLGGPVLYLIYGSTIQDNIPPTTDLHAFVNDHGLKNHFKIGDIIMEHNAISHLEGWVHDVDIWMNKNRLKMNASKMDFIIFCSRKLLPKTNTTSINICQDTVAKSEVVKYLGTWLDKSLTYEFHIKQKCKIVMYNIHKIRHIQYMLTKDACKTLVHGLVISHLNYGNALFIDLPACNLDKLQ